MATSKVDKKNDGFVDNNSANHEAAAFTENLRLGTLTIVAMESRQFQKSTRKTTVLSTVLTTRQVLRSQQARGLGTLNVVAMESWQLQKSTKKATVSWTVLITKQVLRSQQARGLCPTGLRADETLCNR